MSTSRLISPFFQGGPTIYLKVNFLNFKGVAFPHPPLSLSKERAHNLLSTNNNMPLIWACVRGSNLYCGTLWVPLPLPALFFSLFLIKLHPLCFSLPLFVGLIAIPRLGEPQCAQYIAALQRLKWVAQHSIVFLRFLFFVIIWNVTTSDWKHQHYEPYLCSVDSSPKKLVYIKDLNFKLSILH